ncbi:MAG: hypothetical protein K8F59_14925 [Rhodobacteraceae bacterium]|nr:hypothetical protein [Paracoccaceae bacterium]
MPAFFRTALVALAATFLPDLPADAQSTAPAYSARAVHEVPGQPPSTGVIVKSGQNMRLEFEQNGMKIVQILLPATGMMYILNPEAETYFEIPGQPVPSAATEGYVSPCPAQAAPAQCQMIGSDVVSGINVERWVLANGQQARPTTILWDPTRRQALRQDYPDGSSVVMAFKAMETVAGRNTEHWSITVNAPGKETAGGDWWFDPELRIAIRENLPNGQARHLEDIRVGEIDPALFQVPEGWTRQAPPAPQPPAAGSN